jgi:hypothetical protein
MQTDVQPGATSSASTSIHSERQVCKYGCGIGGGLGFRVRVKFLFNASSFLGQPHSE